MSVWESCLLSVNAAAAAGVALTETISLIANWSSLSARMAASLQF